MIRPTLINMVSQIPRRASAVTALSCVFLALAISQAQAPPPGLDKVQEVLKTWEETTKDLKEKVNSVLEAEGSPTESPNPEPTASPTSVADASPAATVASDEDLKSVQKQSDSMKLPLVYILPIEGQVKSIMMTLFKRGLAEAEEKKADLVLLEMDTPGGELSIAEEISLILLGAKVPTATWIKNEGLSAGMLIAISTDKIFMRKMALIGDCQPIFMGAGEITEAPEKILTVVRQYGERAAAEKGYPKDAVVAMIDANRNYQNAACDVSAPTGELLTLRAEEAVCTGFAKSIADTRSDVLSALSLTGASIEEFEMNWAESLAAFITSTSVSSILTLIGLAALFIEYKTPGFGFFGATGLVLLAFVFWGHSIAHLAGYEGALVFLVGVILLAVEIFLIPGFGFIGATGILMMVLGLIATFMRVSWNDPLFIPEFHLYRPLLMTFAIFIGSTVLIFLTLKFLPQSHSMERIGMSLAAELGTQQGYSSYDMKEQGAYVGLMGRCVTDLRPGGIAMINGQRMDVVSDGGYIAVGSTVQVIKVEGLRIIVISKDQPV